MNISFKVCSSGTAEAVEIQIKFQVVLNSITLCPEYLRSSYIDEVGAINALKSIKIQKITVVLKSILFSCRVKLFFQEFYTCGLYINGVHLALVI